MARKRIAIRIDMTAMCDVAFLLLIFFMSTTQFKRLVMTPRSIVPDEVTDHGLGRGLNPRD